MDDGIVMSNPVARTGRLTHFREDRRLHMSPLDDYSMHVRRPLPSMPSSFVLCGSTKRIDTGDCNG